MPEIVIEIAPDGRLTLRGEGFAGPACLPALQRLANALGVTLSATPTGEYWLSADTAPGLTIGSTTPDQQNP